MYAICCKELNTFFTSLIGYVTIAFFLIVIGLWVWIIPETNVLDQGYADMQVLFDFSPYILLVLVPAITMRSIAEEKKMGTLEVLLVSPLTTTDVIVGKYIASFFILFFTLLFTSIYYFSLYYLGSPIGNIDTAAVIGSYIGLLLLSSSFIAFGMFISALTDSQLIAFLLGVLVCFVFYQGFDIWATLQTWQSYSLFITKLGGVYHYNSLSKGIIDSRDIIYFLSINSILLFLTKKMIHFSQ